MAKGDVTYRISDIHINRLGAQAEAKANATKFVEDEDGTLQSIGSWTARLTYTPAALSAKTVAQLNTELITEIKAKNAAIAAKTIV
jgi:hypothetical protein